ncbi:TPA: hypothetical protein ACGXP7_005868 [Bacillus cereus]
MDWSRAKEIISNRIEVADHGAGMSPLDEWWKEMTQILSKKPKRNRKVPRRKIK